MANGFLYAHAGAQLQFGEFGLVATSEFFQYSQSPTVSPTGGRPGVTLVYGRYHALAGYGGHSPHQMIPSAATSGIFAQYFSLSSGTSMMLTSDANSCRAERFAVAVHSLTTPTPTPQRTRPATA